MRHIISTKDFELEWLMQFLAMAHAMRGRRHEQGGVGTGRILASLFYEESLRTRFSFEVAMHMLGGRVISTENATKFSSAAKGETVQDTVRVLGGFVDVIVIRHPDVGTAARAALFSPVPLINGGDGIGEHPTQALIDLFTIMDELKFTDLKQLEGLTVTLLGDLKNGRTIHSLARLLARFGARLRLVAPQPLSIRGDLLAELKDTKADVSETTHLSDVLSKTDVLYVTRVQKERFVEKPEEYEAVRGSYRINRAMLTDGAKQEIIIMHPLPRVDEIAPDVDDLPNAAYFRQAHNGIPVRKALLSMLLTGR